MFVNQSLTADQKEDGTGVKPWILATDWQYLNV